jgi:hypothetical protein
MTAFKQQVVLIVYSSSTPLALAVCVCDAVLGGHQQPTAISMVHEVARGGKNVLLLDGGSRPAALDRALVVRYVLLQALQHWWLVVGSISDDLPLPSIAQRWPLCDGPSSAGPCIL